MPIFDMHIHLESDVFSQASLLARFQEAGIDGGVIISQPPEESSLQNGADFETRLRNVLRLTDGCDTLFPALWIHPFERDAAKKAAQAAAAGIRAFKIICDSFYPYDPGCLDLVSAIAELDRPVIFHSGILWDGGVSSQYNRPLGFEALIQIPKLRFSLAHCAWPWYDECIALYGKFLNAIVQNPRCSTEMFLDLTPGTPRLYRKDLMEKLFGVGYDTGHNILFGSDCSADDYNVDWVKTWKELDDSLYDGLNIPAEIRNCIYHDNLLRFLGVAGTQYDHAYPITGLTL